MNYEILKNRATASCSQYLNLNTNIVVGIWKVLGKLLSEWMNLIIGSALNISKAIQVVLVFIGISGQDCTSTILSVNCFSGVLWSFHIALLNYGHNYSFHLLKRFVGEFSGSQILFTSWSCLHKVLDANLKLYKKTFAPRIHSRFPHIAFLFSSQVASSC
jgi:hypothetical protein